MEDFSLYEQLQMQFTANTHGWVPVLLAVLLVIPTMADETLRRVLRKWDSR